MNAFDPGRAAEPLLASLDVYFEHLDRVGAWLAALPAQSVQLPALILCVAAIAALSQSRAPVALALHGLAALGIAAVAQTFVLEGRISLGLGVYLAAALAWLARRDPAPMQPIALSRGIEVPLAVGLLGLYAVHALHHLDVFPDVYYDELAMLAAARQQLGEIDSQAARVYLSIADYSLDRFRAQLVPFGLQTAAQAGLGPGVLSTRLASAAAAGAALLVAWLSVRRRLGSRAALWMLALCGSAPFLLMHARLGIYVVFSILHGALVFAATLRLAERRDRRSAALLGILWGGSVYFYQLSWLVPGLSGATLLAAWPSAPRRGIWRQGVVVGVAAALTALPAAVWLAPGFGAVRAQTFDARAVWKDDARRAGVRLSSADAPLLRGFEERGTGALAGELGAEMRHAVPYAGSGGEARVLLIGRHRSVAAALARDDLAGGRVLFDGREPTTALGNGLHMLRALVASPSLEHAGRWVVSPLLSPLLIPLLVLGILEAGRALRLPIARALLIWVAFGSLLAAVLGGAFPRRAVLILPFAQALMALPLVALGRRFAAAGRGARNAAGVAAVALFVLVSADAVHRYRDAWYLDLWSYPARQQEPWRPPAQRGWTLPLVKLLRALPAGEEVLMPRLGPPRRLPGGLFRFLSTAEGESALRRRVWVAHGATDARQVRAISCARSTPFTWIGFDAAEHRKRFDTLGADFRVQASAHDGYRLWRVEARLRDGCQAPADPERVQEAGASR